MMDTHILLDFNIYRCENTSEYFKCLLANINAINWKFYLILQV